MKQRDTYEMRPGSGVMEGALGRTQSKSQKGVIAASRPQARKTVLLTADGLRMPISLLMLAGL